MASKDNTLAVLAISNPKQEGPDFANISSRRRCCEAAKRHPRGERWNLSKKVKPAHFCAGAKLWVGIWLL